MPEVSLPTFTASCSGLVSVGVAAPAGPARAVVAASASAATSDRGAVFMWVLPGGRPTADGEPNRTMADHGRASPGSCRVARIADRPLAAAADRLHGGRPAPLRRRVQHPAPRVQDADGDALGPGGDPGALHRARPLPAAGADDRAAPDHGRAVAAAARGARAPRAAQADAPAVPRRADARVRGHGARGRRRRPRALARGRAVRAAPADAGGDARGDPARGVRRHRPGAPRPPRRPARGDAHGDVVARPAVRLPRLARALGGPDPLERLEALKREIDALLADEIADRRADPREDILSLLVARAVRGRRADGRRGDPRPAHDAAARRPRDDGDRPGLDVRPAAAPPRGASTG